MSDSAPAVSVIVPVYGGRHLIGPCLESIPDGVEVIVVDDASPVEVDDVIRRARRTAVVLRNAENRGFGASANRGLSEARGEVRVVLNSDARLQPHALERLVSAFLADPKVGIAGPRLRFPDGTHQTSAAAFPTIGSFAAGSHLLNELYRRFRPRGRFRWELGLTRRDHDRSQDVDWVHGTCIAIRDACFDDTGGFDVAYRMYVEECDLCWRARAAGWTVRYVADAEVIHLGGASGTGDPGRQAQFNLDGEQRFISRAYGADVVWRWRLARVVSSLIKVVLLAPPAAVDARARARLRWHIAALAHLLRFHRIVRFRDEGCP